MKRFAYAILLGGITMLEYVLCPDINNSSFYVTISWMIVLNFVLSTILIKLTMGLFSMFYFFVSFFYVFHFGQVLLKGLIPDYEYDYLNYLDSGWMLSFEYTKQSVILSMVVVNLFVVGGLLVNKNLQPKSDEKYSILVWKYIFYLFLPVRLLYDAIQTYVGISMGYLAAINSTRFIPGVFSALGNIWYAVAPIYLLYMEKASDRKKFLFIMVLYLCVTMLSGNRGHQIVCLVTLFYAYLSRTKALSTKTIFKYGLLSIIGLFLVDIIYELRHVGLNQFMSDSSNVINSVFKKNIILETVGTFGETIYTPYLVVEGYGKDFHPFFGESFIKSIASIVPDVSGSLKEINNEALFTNQLDTESNIGGSFAGEMYYSFGKWYPLMSAIIGFLYASLSVRVNNALKNNKIKTIGTEMAVLSLSLWWVRDCAGNMTRSIVWVAILVFFLNRIFKRKSIYRI